MPRRNSNKRRIPQARRRYDGGPGGRMAAWVPPVPVEVMVVPAGKCGRKLRFTKSQAEKALKQAQQSRANRGLASQERRVYECPRCGDWHLTSRETWEDPS